MQHDDLSLYAAKHGWVLLGLPERRSFFLHNPLSSETIPLPRLKSSRCVSAATFTDNPKSPKCEILVLCRCIAHRRLWLYRYCPSGDTSWSTKFLEFTEGRMFSMYYSKEYLYYLSEDATLRSYNLACGTLMTHISKIVPPDFAFGYWMIENEEDLIMVCKYMLSDSSFQWLAYKLDSAMSWVPANWRSKKVAIFISGKIAISRPLNVQNNGDCLVFSQEVDRDDIYKYRVACYSLTERKEVESKEYNWIGMSCCKKKMAFV